MGTGSVLCATFSSAMTLVNSLFTSRVSASSSRTPSSSPANLRKTSQGLSSLQQLIRYDKTYLGQSAILSLDLHRQLPTPLLRRPLLLMGTRDLPFSLLLDRLRRSHPKRWTPFLQVRRLTRNLHPQTLRQHFLFPHQESLPSPLRLPYQRSLGQLVLSS